MSSTTLVRGTFELPNSLKHQQYLAEQFGGERMTQQRNQTYVSRLQGVQMAVDANLDKLVKDSPTRRAALLTFNHELTYYGDGTMNEPFVIRGDKLNSMEELKHAAEKESKTELKPVAQTKAKLAECVYNLEEGGQTALGPAVVFALNIASKRQGSRIVICTDGLANRGLGNLETAQDEKVAPAVKMQALDEGNRFYEDITEVAREKGVSISVITIKGTTCLLPVIGQLADGTNGNVTIVDLLNMRDEFASILDQQVIATNVEATLVLHRGLYIRDPEKPAEKVQTIKQKIGNATKKTELSFEFGVRDKKEVKKKYQIDLDRLNQLPFQVQVAYTAADGSRALRVLTQLKEATEHREVAEVNAIRSVIAKNHIRNTANDMMVNDLDDEDDESERAHLREAVQWSRPVVQKQRVAYLNDLSRKVRSRPSRESDHFNESRWNKVSNDLQLNAVANYSRKKAASSRNALPARSDANDVDDGQREKSSGILRKSWSKLTDRARGVAKKNYGVVSSNIGDFNDDEYKDMYRYKNISSEYMREKSPTPDESTTMSSHIEPHLLNKVEEKKVSNDRRRKDAHERDKKTKK